MAYLVLVRKPREVPPFTRESGDAAADPVPGTGGPVDPDPADDPADDTPADDPADDTAGDRQPTDDRPADDAREPVPAEAPSGGGPDPAPDRTP